LYGPTTYAQASGELSNNIIFFNTELFAATGGINTTTFSRYSMITPAISGLFNGAALQAILDNGIECVVGDNSVALLIPPNLYHGFYTTVEVNGYAGVFVIPRAPTEIYFDVSTVASEVIEYNSRYGLAGTIVAESYNATLDQIMALEGTKTARNLMLYRHDPYMFHQGNLKHFNYTRPGEDEKQWSLLTMWVQTVVEYYTALMNFPILNVGHDEMFILYKRRMATDACGATGTMTVVGGQVTGITLSSAAECDVAVTGLTSCTGVADCTVETYGTDTTVWAALNADSVSLPASFVWTD